MPQTLTMSLCVDADLWKAFERAADRSHRQGEEVLRDLMRNFVAEHGPGVTPGDESGEKQPCFDFGEGDEALGKGHVDGQIDLEDFLAGRLF